MITMVINHWTIRPGSPSSKSPVKSTEPPTDVPTTLLGRCPSRIQKSRPGRVKNKDMGVEPKIGGFDPQNAMGFISWKTRWTKWDDFFGKKNNNYFLEIPTCTVRPSKGVKFQPWFWLCIWRFFGGSNFRLLEDSGRYFHSENTVHKWVNILLYMILFDYQFFVETNRLWCNMWSWFLYL